MAKPRRRKKTSLPTKALAPEWSLPVDEALQLLGKCFYPTTWRRSDLQGLTSPKHLSAANRRAKWTVEQLLTALALDGATAAFRVSVDTGLSTDDKEVPLREPDKMPDRAGSTGAGEIDVAHPATIIARVEDAILDQPPLRALASGRVKRRRRLDWEKIADRSAVDEPEAVRTWSAKGKLELFAYIDNPAEFWTEVLMGNDGGVDWAGGGFCVPAERLYVPVLRSANQASVIALRYLTPAHFGGKSRPRVQMFVRDPRRLLKAATELPRPKLKAARGTKYKYLFAFELTSVAWRQIAINEVMAAQGARRLNQQDVVQALVEYLRHSSDYLADDKDLKGEKLRERLRLVVAHATHQVRRGERLESPFVAGHRMSGK